MIFPQRLLLVSLCLIVVVGTASCSNVKNRDKKKSAKADPEAVVSITVTARSTTTGAQTTDSLDSKLQAVITKSLSKALIQGANAKSLFSPTALIHAADSFDDNSDAKKNEVSAKYSHMVSANANESIVVAEISQRIVDKKNNEHERTGKIYFDTSGIILGFEFADTPASATTTTGAQT